MLKTLTRDDTTTTPYVATKNWNLSNVANEDVVLAENGNPVAAENVDYFPTDAQVNYNCNVAKEDQELDLVNYREGLKRTGLFYPDQEPLNIDGTFKRMVYTQIKTMFYNNYRDITKVWGTEKIDFDTSQTKKFLADSIKLFDIPTAILGQKIVEKSVSIIDNTLDNDYLITDDGNCNLFAGPNLFSKQQELGDFVNIFLSGSDDGCVQYFSFLPPDPQINLAARLTGQFPNWTASLSWTLAGGNYTGQVLEKSIDSGSTYLTYQFFGPTTTTFNDTNVATSSLYYYRLYAFNLIGTSSYSNTASISTNPLIAEEPWDEYATGQTSNFNSGSGLAGPWLVVNTGNAAEETWDRFTTGQTGTFQSNNSIYGWSGPWTSSRGFALTIVGEEWWDEYTTGQSSSLNQGYGLKTWKTQASGA